MLSDCDFETILVANATLALELIVHNIDNETMHVSNTVWAHDGDDDTRVSDRLLEIHRSGKMAVPVFDIDVSSAVMSDGTIIRAGDVLFDRQSDTIKSYPLLWTDTAETYRGDGAPLRYGLLSRVWRGKVMASSKI